MNVQDINKKNMINSRKNPFNPLDPHYKIKN